MKITISLFLLLSLLFCSCNGMADGEREPTTAPTEEPTKGEDEMNTETKKYKKYFTLSYDDGTMQDLKLIAILRKYNVTCCTFNVNTGLYGANWEWVGLAVNVPGLEHRRFTEGDLRSGIYNGFELTVHTLTHPSLKIYDNSPEDIIREVQGDSDNIEAITGIKPIGMAWPGGDTEFTDTTVRQVLKYTDIRYARCTTPTYSFELPERFMKWYPTCAFSDPRTFELAQQFIDAEPTDGDMLFYVWGHGFEMDIPGQNSYEEFEQLVKMMSEADDVILVTNREFYELYKDTIPS